MWHISYPFVQKLPEWIMKYQIWIMWKQPFPCLPLYYFINVKTKLNRGIVRYRPHVIAATNMQNILWQITSVSWTNITIDMTPLQCTSIPHTHKINDLSITFHQNAYEKHLHHLQNWYSLMCDLLESLYGNIPLCNIDCDKIQTLISTLELNESNILQRPFVMQSLLQDACRHQ